MQAIDETTNADFTYTRIGRVDYLFFCAAIFVGMIVLMLLLSGAAVIFAVGWQLSVYILFVKRLHDRGISGWWSLLNLIPYIGGCFILYLIFVPGDVGSNAFGPPPKSIVRGWLGGIKRRLTGG